MSTQSDSGVASSWEILADHDWSDGQPIETTLCDALQHLNCSLGTSPLYDYIDLEAAVDALDSEGTGRGASEIRFDIEDYEIRLLQDGTIEARKRQETAKPFA